VAGAANLIALADRAQNTGSGVGIYSQFADQLNEESEIRQRLEAEMVAAIKPDDADHSKGFRGPEQRVGDLLQLFRERPEEADAVVSDLEDTGSTRATSLSGGSPARRSARSRLRTKKETDMDEIQNLIPSFRAVAASEVTAHRQFNGDIGTVRERN
jgi:hypothetical protein